MVELFIFVLGAVMASFLNCISFRIPLGISVLTPGSFCPSCGKVLRPKNLIPICSYIYQRGRCTYCYKKIPLQYLLVEVVLPILYLMLYFRYGFSVWFLSAALTISMLFFVSLIDIRHLCIYDLHVLILGILMLIGNSKLITGENYDFSKLFIPGILFVFFVILANLKTVPLGEGDLLIMSILSTGFNRLDCLAFIFLTIWTAAIYSIILLIRGYSIKSRVPLVPFISISYFIVLVTDGSICRLFGWTN